MWMILCLEMQAERFALLPAYPLQPLLRMRIWLVFTFPTEIIIPLEGKGQEIAVLFVASTFCMLSYVENARITVTYADGTSTHTKLIYPLNIDDWLTSALTTEAEIFYFSNYNHATVQRIRIDPSKELAGIRIEAVANEVILGVAGISISR